MKGGTLVTALRKDHPGCHADSSLLTAPSDLSTGHLLTPFISMHCEALTGKVNKADERCTVPVF